MRRPPSRWPLISEVDVKRILDTALDRAVVIGNPPIAAVAIGGQRPSTEATPHEDAPERKEERRPIAEFANEPAGVFVDELFKLLG